MDPTQQSAVETLRFLEVAGWCLVVVYAVYAAWSVILVVIREFRSRRQRRGGD
jgi:hypothetical protein